MKRVLEKLSAERLSQEKALAEKLGDIGQRGELKELGEIQERIKFLLSELEKINSQKRGKGIVFPLWTGSREKKTNLLITEIFRTLLLSFERQNRLLEHFSRDLQEVAELLAALGEARDREWDALGSNHVGIIFKSLEWRLEQVASECQEARILLERFNFLRAKLDELLLALQELPRPESKPIREVIGILRDWRYASFENRFRGSEEVVRGQLERYASLFPPGGKVIDLGCGRGEMVEILREKGIEAFGIDLNDSMIALCQEKGLPCEKADLIEALFRQPDNSLAGIFSSQVIEHLPRPTLELMLDLGYLKLSSSGVLVLETINPASVFALVQVYYLDPSHERPIHPQTLKFLLSTAGFQEVEIRYAATLDTERLRPLPGTDDKTTLLNQNIDLLNDLLFAPVNYAAIAWKQKPEEKDINQE